MVISKPIRSHKRTIPNYINVDTVPRKPSTRDKIITILKSNKKGLSLMGISDDANIRSTGNLYATLKRMTKQGELELSQCTHCGRTEIYKLNI